MNLRHLSIFQTVCEEGSITGAAKALCMTQPAISHAIAELEETLGTQLFDRISRKIVLNESGRLFLSKVIPLLDLYDDLEKSSKELDRHAPLRIGSSITIANFLLPSVVLQFNQTYPGNPVTVTIDNARAVEELLLHNEIDLALLEGVISREQLEKIPFSAYPLAIICSPAHPLAAGGKSVTIDQVVAEPLLMREHGSAIRDTFDSAMLLHNISITPTWTSVNSRALLEAVKHNLGLSVLPRIFVDEDLRQGTIMELEVQDLDISCVNHVVFHKDKFQSEAFQGFINLVLFA